MPVAVLVSGSGSNLQALLEAAARPGASFDVCVVISDRPGVLALERAEAAGVPAEVVAWSGHEDREAFTIAVCDVAEKFDARALVLAGFMRVLAPEAMIRYPDRILNTHPALLPAFPGAHALREAIEHGVLVTGVTIHFVDELVDHGPIIWQEAIEVLHDDDEASLLARVQRIEHRMYPIVVDAFCAGDLTVDGRRVTWRRR